MRRALEPFLRALGIDPKRYWLLMDLFAQLSLRGEITDRLGTSGYGAKAAGLLYCLLFGVIGLMFGASHPSIYLFLLLFMSLTTLLMMSILLSEAGNSLINPTEALVLAHQPINGATYTAAKLSHLLRIIAYLVSAMNVIPAVAGLFLLPGAQWFYPLEHLGLGYTVGLLAGLSCCAIFGWLMRFIPAKRLKAAGQFVAVAPFLSMSMWQLVKPSLVRLNLSRFLPESPEVRWSLAGAAILCGGFLVISGLRWLSADYLIQVSTLVRSGPSRGSKPRRAGIGRTFAMLVGGQGGNAAFAFVSRMMLRDWQFGRQLIGAVIPLLVAMLSALGAGWRIDPFSGEFSTIHILPHFFGMALFTVCEVVMYGSDYKGAWMFSLAPAGIYKGFSRGIFAVLWVEFIVVPQLFLLIFFAAAWGPLHALIFCAYSLACGSFFLSLEIRRIRAIPFSKQLNASRSSAFLPLMILGGLVIAGVVAIQYYVLFQSPWAVIAATLVIGAAAIPLTTNALKVLETSLRFDLGRLSGETGAFYKEVDL
jgi:hypothetical protein